MENINKIRPWQITGLTDSRGDFDFILDLRNRKLELEYYIILGDQDMKLLELIREYFNCGYIIKTQDNKLKYFIKDIKDLRRNVIPHFKLYPCALHTKNLNYDLFKTILNFLSDGELSLTNEVDIMVLLNLINKLHNPMGFYPEVRFKKNYISNDSIVYKIASLFETKFLTRIQENVIFNPTIFDRQIMLNSDWVQCSYFLQTNILQQFLVFFSR